MEQAATDAFFDVETDTLNRQTGAGADPWGTWKVLLSKPSNLQGCAEIHLQRFHGRNGMISFKAMRCSTEKGELVGKKSDRAKVEANRVAKELHALAVDDARREGCDTYRVQLMLWDGNGNKSKLVDGSYAGVRIDPVSGNVLWNASGEQTPESKWREIAEWSSAQLKEERQSAGQMIGTAVGTMITAVGAADELAARRIQMAKEYEASVVPASAEAMNDRYRMGLNALGGTMRELMRYTIWNKTGKWPGPGEPGGGDVIDVDANSDADDAKLQTELRDFFAKLPGETHDKLREKFGPANYDGLTAVLNGDFPNFQRNAPMLLGVVGRAIHTDALVGVLTTDELKELTTIFGEPPG